jgi:hypothetical protein
MATIIPWDVAHKTAAGEIETWRTVGRPLPEMQMKVVDA